jgi:polygalacturonase
MTAVGAMKKTQLIQFAGILVASAVATVSAADFDVRKLGAIGDGKTFDTAAVQKAIDACGKAGGGTVQVPPGIYRCQPLTLRSHTTLHLAKGATLLASDEPKDFLETGDDWLKASNSDFMAFINGSRLTNIAIVGEGTVDGSGSRWWGAARKAKEESPISVYTLPRPRLIVFNRCQNVRLQGISLANSPTFHFVPTDCDDVVVDSVSIHAPEDAVNTDGIDPSRCHRVLIANCRIDVGDDNVAIKSGRKVEGREFACQDITITNCVFLNGHGLSIGSETEGGVKNVRVEKVTFINTDNGVRIKSPRGKGGVIDGLFCRDLTMTNCKPALTLTCYYPKIPKTDTAQPFVEGTPVFRNIRIENLTADCPKDAGIIIGLPESPVTDVVLKNIRIKAKTGLTIRNAKGVRLQNVVVTVESGEPIIQQDAEVEIVAAK